MTTKELITKMYQETKDTILEKPLVCGIIAGASILVVTLPFGLYSGVVFGLGFIVGILFEKEKKPNTDENRKE